MLKLPSIEVELLANIVGRDPSSNTSDNIRYIRELTNLNPWSYSASRIKAELPSQAVPENEKWRLGLMTALIQDIWIDSRYMDVVETTIRWLPC